MEFFISEFDFTSQYIPNALHTFKNNSDFDFEIFFLKKSHENGEHFSIFEFMRPY